MDPFLGEIRIFPFSFAPAGWAQCNGQLMPLSQNTALFSLLGTMYGGDGKSTFALPDLIGRAPLAAGHNIAAGLSERMPGATGGSEFVTLLPSEMPTHAHTASGTTAIGELSSPAATTPLSRSTGRAAYHAPDGGLVAMSPYAVGVAGADAPHNNLMPYVVFNFCIALQGVYPQRP